MQLPRFVLPALVAAIFGLQVVVPGGLVLAQELRRTWTDASGKFQVRAVLLGFEDGKVRLKKEGGKVASVGIERLSEEDQDYVRKWSAARNATPVAEAGPLPLDLSYLRPDHIAAVVAYPQRAWSSKLVKPLAPFNAFKGPIDFQNIRQLLVLFPTEFVPSLEAGPGDPGLPLMIVQLDPGVDRDSQLLAFLGASKLKAMTHQGKSYFVADRGQADELDHSDGPPNAAGFGASPSAAGLVVGQHTLVVASTKELLRTLEPHASNAILSEALKNHKASDELTVVATLDAARNRIDGLVDAAKNSGGVPPFMLAFIDLPKEIKSLRLTADLDSAELLQLQLTGRGEPSGATIQQGMQAALTIAREAFREIKNDLPKQVPPPFADVAVPLAEDLLSKIEIQRQAADVTIKIGKPSGLEDAVARIGPVFQQDRRIVDANRLKMLGLAFHNYHDVAKAFPAQAIMDKQGKPLLSWRVAVLPYLEQSQLYQRFRLDEPWDSPHNSKLLERMPDVYQNTGRPRDGKTCILGFVGQRGLFPQPAEKRGRRIFEMKDGTANTIMLVEAGDDKAVPWTKPSDLSADDAELLRQLGQLPQDGFFALLCDGSVRKLPHDVENEKLKALVTPDGGERVEIP